MIAVTGMAIRAPGAAAEGMFWARVAEGADCIERFPEDAAALGPVDRRLLAHGTRVTAGGILGGVADFDAGFFGLSQLDAAILDPQQRVFLELVRHALDNAAVPAFRHEATAVFAGCGMSSYLLNNLLADPDLIDRVGAYPLMLGNDKDFLATRVSHKFGFGGPSMSVQTACSTSLVAVHVAAQSLLAGECDTAIAGGVTVRVPERRGYLYQPDGIMSADGVGLPFDAAASGFVPSNGAVVLVLRRLEDALAEGDPVRAVLLASAVNNDGAARPGFTAPGVEGQVRVLSEALALSGLSPGDITHVETHGTATGLGDAVELEALRRVYGASPEPCYLGAGKANFGHTDTAAGGIGLVKAILALQHRKIPPVANFVRPNPRLEIDGTRFVVPTELTEWVAGDRPRRAAVTSLGLGGTNAHVIVEEGPARRRATGTGTVLPVSGHSASAAATRARQIELALAAQPDLHAALARALAGQRQLPYRVVVDPSARAPRVAEVSKAEPKAVVFAFPGGGAQHPAMASSLAAAEPAFADALGAALNLMEPLAGPAIREVILRPGPGAAADLRRPAIGLPALFCVQFAIWRLLAHWGVTPSAVIGHSSGEYVAACLAGVLEPGEAARLVATRAELFETAPKGAMVGLLRPELDVRCYLDTAPGLDIAAVNGAAETVVGGPLASVTALEARLADCGIPSQRIHVEVAAHTAAVAGVAEALERAATGIPARTPALPWASNVTGTWVTAAELGPGYWGAHLRQTVRFADGIRAATATPGTIVLDMGPGQVLKASLERDRLPDGVLALAALPHPRADEPPAAHLRRTAAALWSAGADVDLSAALAQDEADRAPLPPYPFERTRCWIGAPEQAGRTRQGHQFYEPALEPLGEPAAGHDVPPGGWLVVSDGSAFAAGVLGQLDRDQVPVAATVAAEGLGTLQELPGPGTTRGALVLTGSGAVRAYHAITGAARALAARPHGPRELVSISDARDPVSSLSAALIRVIRNEYRDLAVRSIEAEADAVARGHLVREILMAAGPDAVLRDGQRYERALRLMPAGMAAGPGWREAGVWIISGGLGAVGRTLAVHLAETLRARVVLVPRSREGTYPPEAPLRDEALRAIRAAGGDYEIVLGDIADPATAGAAIERAERVFGRLDGVIHAAGLPSGGVIELRSADDAEQVLRPKLDGLLALAEALGERDLDAVVLCSALNAVLGTPGQAEHCAANGFLDAFAAAHSRPGRRVISIGWSAWQGIGQAARADIPEALRRWREQTVASALTPEEGCELFDAAVASGRTHVIVSADDPASLRRLITQASRVAAGAATESVIDESLRTPVERRMAELWGELLAAPTVRADDDFFALGGHSLAAMQLVSRLRETFDVPVTLPELLERPVLRDQAALVEELLLDVVEQLDDSEVTQRLGATAPSDDSHLTGDTGFPPDW